MAKQTINVGAVPNDGTGDTLRDSFVKTNDNFTDVYTNKQDTLVSATNIKTVNGSSILGSGNLVVGGSSGIFGISNSSGVYTYYATLTLAMAAATIGQTIEMFADVTETGNVTITLKDGVNINGNGHTYNLNTTTATNAFIATATEVKMAFSNITLVKSGTGSGIVLGSGVATNQFNGKSCTIRVISPNSFGISVLTNVFTGYIDGFNVIATGSASNGIYSIRGTITNCFAISTSGYGIVSNLSNTTNCYGESLGAGSGIEGTGTSGILASCFGKSNTGVGIIAGVITTACTGISSGGTGLYVTGSTINGCTGISSSSKGIFASAGIINSSYGYSAAEWGILIQNGKVNNSYGYGAASVGLQVFNNSQANNCVFETLSGSICVGLSSATAGSLNNCTIINLWNNASGHCLVANSTIPILNCVFEVTNASAQAIYSASALTLKYASNTFKNSTTAVSAVITQGITNSADTKGNILI